MPRQSLLVLFTIIFLQIQLSWAGSGTADSFDDLNRALGKQQQVLVEIADALQALAPQLQWYDAFYLKRVLISLNAVQICLFYQLELNALYEEISAINAPYVHHRRSRRQKQLTYTQGNLELEHRQILQQYMQIVDYPTLKIVGRLNDALKSLQDILQRYATAVGNDLALQSDKGIKL